MKRKAAHHSVSHRATPAIIKKQYSEELKSFLVHAILYLLVNFGLFIYFYSSNGDLKLFYWVLIGWGVGLVAHALAVFGIMKLLHKEW
jgi:hypothetical protein